MRLGAPIYQAYDSPAGWVQAVQAKGYRAAYCPIQANASDAEIAAYAQAAVEADIVIAEVGAWGNNPLHPDPAVSAAGIANSQALLAFADRIGARCCVNIAGSRGDVWNDPHDDNLTSETFDLLVEVTREIIDGVKPTRAKWALECMPFDYPNSTTSYVKLFKAVDRPQFGVHFDPVNITNCPELYYINGALTRDFVRKLGPHIVSCHFKDIILSRGSSRLFNLDECRPGTGNLNYVYLLTALDKLPADLPVMLEHLDSEAEYDLAAAHVRQVAAQVGVAL